MRVPKKNCHPDRSVSEVEGPAVLSISVYFSIWIVQTFERSAGIWKIVVGHTAITWTSRRLNALLPRPKCRRP